MTASPRSTSPRSTSARSTSARPTSPRPARLAYCIPDAGASGIIDASDLRAEPLVSSLAASLARSRPMPQPQPRARADAWPMLVLSTLLVAVAFTGVAAISRLAPGVANERARVIGGHHLSMRTVSTSPSPSQAVVKHPAPFHGDGGGASPAAERSAR
jgi:hypothetical protein